MLMLMRRNPGQNIFLKNIYSSAQLMLFDTIHKPSHSFFSSFYVCSTNALSASIFLLLFLSSIMPFISRVRLRTCQEHAEGEMMRRAEMSFCLLKVMAVTQHSPHCTYLAFFAAIFQCKVMHSIKK